MLSYFRRQKMALHLRHKDWIAAGIFTVVLTGLFFLVATASGLWEKSALLFVAVCLVTLITFEGFRRIEMWMKMSEYDYQEIESMLYLSQQISFRQPLPSMRGWAVSPDFAVLILRCIRDCHPAVIVDLGSGVSTLISGYVLEQLGQGEVFGFDHEPSYGAKTRKEIAKHQLEKWAKVIDAPLAPLTLTGRTWQWYDLSKFELPASIDLLIVDGPPDRLQALSRYPAVPALAERLSRKAVILVDDVNGKDEREIIARWLKEYPDFSCERVGTEKGAAVLRR